MKQKSLDNIVKKIKKSVQYDRKIIPGKKVLSASMAGSEPLINYFTITKGINNNQSSEFDASNLGSLLHKSLESIFISEENFLTEHRMEANLSGTDWTITGSADLIDTINKIIYDYKLTTTSSINKIKSTSDHQYILQLSILRWLQNQQYNLIKSFDNDYIGCILAFDKKASKMNKESEYILNPIYPELLSLEDTEQLLRDITSNLDTFIESDTLPPQCASNTLLWYKKPGDDKATPMKCKYYCNHNNICPHYSKTGDLMKSLGIPQAYKYKRKSKQKENK